MTRSPFPGRGARFTHGCASCLGAFLLFQVQLIVAKAILPRFGGAPAVWTTCMLFFQALLLAGYAYAHASSRWLAPRLQGGVHLGLLALALCVLPIAPQASDAGSGPPVLGILAHLGRSVAMPCFVLSACSPLLQAWLTLGRGGAARGGSGAYRLYAWSNAGSMLALLSYPLAIEPWLTTRAQVWTWSAGFAAFALLSAACVWKLWSAAPAARLEAVAQAGADDGAGTPGWPRRLLWLALPACAATLLLAVTNQMCQEVAVVPLLWVLPLGLYLLSFVLGFASERWYSRAVCLPILILAVAVMAQALTMGARVGIAYAVPVYSLGLFVCCMFCHGELAARRPAPRHLTSFYLMIALGGAFGGAFVSLLAPLLFRGFDELVVGLLACSALATAFAWKDPAYRRAGRGAWHPVVPALLVVVSVIGLLLGARLLGRSRPDVRESRDFFGILRVGDVPAPGGAGRIRYLTHGGTRHGQQFQDPERSTWPTTYYGRTSGIGILLDERNVDKGSRDEGSRGSPARIGIVGLGAGILAAYGRAGDTYRFYEISPRVIEVAAQEFTFLRDSAARIEIAPGDARLSLEREGDQGFDVLVLDAFSSDAIPVHLLTVEAFELYARHLAPGGVLALHVTTRHLDLGPLIEGLARRSGLATWEIQSAADDELGLLAARWILVTSAPEWLARPRLRAAGRPVDAGAGALRPWTDDYSNLLRVLR